MAAGTRIPLQALIAEARRLGFCAVGVTAPREVDAVEWQRHEEWLSAGYAADMDYLQQHKDIRRDPRLLFSGVQSMIVTAMNYYPDRRQQGDAQFAFYAYGADYHWVVKEYLGRLSEWIACNLVPENFSYEARAFTDSAPLMERYWAVEAGLGFVGRNQLLIVPGVGSYVLLGTLMTNLPVELLSRAGVRKERPSCGSCLRCREACPTGALCEGYVDANRCISYQTIESRAERIPEEVARTLGNRVYGCDACQEACPWNQRFASPTAIPEFQPQEHFLILSREEIANMGSGDFKRLFAHSAVKRAGLKGLKRNVKSSEGEG